MKPSQLVTGEIMYQKCHFLMKALFNKQQSNI